MLFWTVDICAQAEEIYSVLIISLFNELMMVIPQGKLGVYFCILLFFSVQLGGVVACFCKACELQNMLISDRCCCCTFEYFIKEA